jgi:transcription-repair coupling factor (superfamily II helicase)
MTNKTTTVSIDFDQETFDRISNFSIKSNLSVDELIKTSLLESISKKTKNNNTKSSFNNFFTNYKAKRNIFQSMTDEEMSDFIRIEKFSDYYYG